MHVVVEVNYVLIQSLWSKNRNINLYTTSGIINRSFSATSGLFGCFFLFQVNVPICSVELEGNRERRAGSLGSEAHYSIFKQTPNTNMQG